MSDPAALALLQQEAHALLVRLERVRPFVLNETMVPAAALSPGALLGIERTLDRGKRQLSAAVRAYLAWLTAPGQQISPPEAQRRLIVLRLRFNDVLSQLDLFADVISQRSEHEVGVWLAGLDALAQDALRIPGTPIELPATVCYLDRGPGAAIRRARTRLPGGSPNPVAIIRVPRERMVGHGIGSSLVHEVGHQVAALLDLVPSLRPTLAERRDAAAPADAAAWRLWERWVSEVVSDLWSVGQLGISSTLGLIAVVSLPRWVVFRVNVNDPHPSPWIRVHVSCALGDTLYPHPQWKSMAATWTRLYPADLIPPAHRELFAALLRTLPAFTKTLVEHRPPRLAGRALADVLPTTSRRPEQLTGLVPLLGHPQRLQRLAPTLAMATVGQARARNAIDPAAEAALIDRLLVAWAVEQSMRSGDAARPSLPAHDRPDAVPALSAALAKEARP